MGRGLADMSMRSTGAVLADRGTSAEWPTAGDNIGSHAVRVSRTRVLENGIGLVETLRVDGPPAAAPRSESFSADYQVCLPFHGAFIWHVGSDDVVADPNRVLFVAGGEGFRLSQPIPGGYGELIVTLQPPLLSEMLGVPERRLADHSLFRGRSRPAEPNLQRLGLEGLHRRARPAGGPMPHEEWLVAFLRASLVVPAPAPAISPSTARLIARAKTYLAAHLSTQVRLTEVARAAGTTPAYLTTLFRRVEGRPLHQYLVQLRLARALVELPHTTDLIALACALGFSSHSHFSAAFRRAFGCTPSSYRETRRRDRAPVIAAGRRRVEPAASALQ
jgi:AraC family transcriptional regulator